MNKTILVALCVIPASAGVVATLATRSTEHRAPLAPHAVVMESAQAVRDNDVARFIELAGPEGELDRLAAEWNQKRAVEVDPTDELGFRVTMGMFTEEGAEEKLMAQLEPKLAELRGQKEFFAQMLTGLAQAQVSQQTELSAEQRAESAEVLAALQKQLVEHDFTDPALARKAVDIACRTARALEIDSLAKLNALEFDQLLEKGDLVAAGFKDILALYGIDLNAWLDSVHAETLSERDGVARVRVGYELLGLKRDTEVELVFDGKRWRSRESAEPRVATPVSVPAPAPAD